MVFNKLNFLELNQQENKKVAEYFRKNNKYLLTKFLKTHIQEEVDEEPFLK